MEVARGWSEGGVFGEPPVNPRPMTVGGDVSEH